MSTNRLAIIVAVVLVILTFATSILTNVATDRIPERLEPYTWLAWPLLVISLIIAIFLTILPFLPPKWLPWGRATSKKTLVLIDNEPDVRKELKCAAAQIAGLSVHPLPEINSPESLSRHLSQLHPRPDGVILDFDIPVGGITLYKWLQEWSRERSRELPIVFYTRHADHPDNMNEMLAVGASPEDILLKGEGSEKDIFLIEQRFQQLWTKTSDDMPDESKSVSETRTNEDHEKPEAIPTLDQVGQALDKDDPPRSHNPASWEEMMRIREYRGQIGEIRTPEDWRNLPRDVPVRVVFFRDSNGPVLRWSSDKQLNEQIKDNQQSLAMAEGSDIRRYKKQLDNLQNRIITHEKLATYLPKVDSTLYKGYITLKANDDLIVVAAGKKTLFHL